MQMTPLLRQKVIVIFPINPTLGVGVGEVKEGGEKEIELKQKGKKE